MSTVMEELPAAIPTLRHNDPSFAEQFANRRSGGGENVRTPNEESLTEGNSEKTGNNGAVSERHIGMSSSRILWKIYDAVSRQQAAFEPLRNSSYKETDRHAELGGVLRLANNGASPKTLISILKNSRYPITKALAKKLMDETKMKPGVSKIPQGSYDGGDLDDPEMTEYYELLEMLGYE